MIGTTLTTNGQGLSLLDQKDGEDEPKGRSFFGKFCGIVGFIMYILLVTILTFGSAYKIITDAASSNVPTVVGDCTDATDVASWDGIKGPTMNTKMADCAGLGTVDKCTSIFSLN